MLMILLMIVSWLSVYFRTMIFLFSKSSQWKKTTSFYQWSKIKDSKMRKFVSYFFYLFLHPPLCWARNFPTNPIQLIRIYVAAIDWLFEFNAASILVSCLGISLEKALSLISNPEKKEDSNNLVKARLEMFTRSPSLFPFYLPSLSLSSSFSLFPCIYFFSSSLYWFQILYSYFLIILLFFSFLSVDTRTWWLYSLQKGKIPSPKIGILGLILNSIRWWGSCSGAPRSLNNTFIVITLWSICAWLVLL